jgi:ubiquinone/menaquinone biosynthesis C-methylase UbiE
MTPRQSEAPAPAESLVGSVRDRYAKIASGEIAGCGCACNAAVDAQLAAGAGYAQAELAAVPAEANLGLGCGAPLAALALEPGETVVDLGSGPGLDAFLAARQVGPQGRVIGIDMTPEMLERARAAAERHGIANVEFREGRLEALPLPDASVDAVTSNCVINLVPDKPAVFREIARVLVPDGRVVVSDLVLDRDLPPALARDLTAYVGCIGGAAPRAAYMEWLAEAGLEAIEVLAESDYLETVTAAAPGEIETLLTRLGVEADELRGTVTSVTFRARKPA